MALEGEVRVEEVEEESVEDPNIINGIYWWEHEGASAIPLDFRPYTQQEMPNG